MVPHNFLSNFYPVACINVGDQQPDRFRMRHGSGTRRIVRPDGRMNGHREPTGNVHLRSSEERGRWAARFVCRGNKVIVDYLRRVKILSLIKEHGLLKVKFHIVHVRVLARAMTSQKVTPVVGFEVGEFDNHPRLLR